MANINANYSQNVDNLFNSVFIDFYTSASTANGISIGEANLAAGQVLPSSVVWAGGCYGDGVVVAVSSTSGTSAAVSYNGGQSALGIWRAKVLPTTATWKAVAFGNGKFVAISNNASGTAAATSVDKGETWQASTMGSLTSATHNSIAFGNNVWVALDSTSGSNQLRTNVYNGSTWTAYTQSTGLTCTGTWTSITFGNGIFVAVCSGSAVAATSTDGINWTQRVLPASTAWSSVTWGGTGFYTCNKYVAVSSTSGTAYAYSSDGITWTAGVLPVSAAYTSICYGGWDGIFVTVNATNGAGGMLTSVDGINWTSRSTAAANSGFIMFAPIPWCSGDDLIINNGAIVTQNTDQTKYWKTISIVDGKFLVQNTSTSTPMRFGTGKLTSATQARTITCTNGLGSFEGSGDFIQLGVVSNGTASQTRTSPYLTGDYIPAVWVGTGDDISTYEIYTNVTSMKPHDIFSTARNGLKSVGPGNGGTCFIQSGDQTKTQYKVLTGGVTLIGSRVVTVTSTAGLDVGSFVTGRGIGSQIAQPYGAIVESIVDSTHFIMNLPASATNTNLTLIAIAPLGQQFGTTLTFGDGVNGKIPPNGHKILVPNIMFTDFTPANMQGLWAATTDLPCRFGGNNAAGSWVFNKCLFGESLGDFGQAQSVTMTDCGHSYVPFISECYQVNWTRVGCALPPVVQYCVWTAVGGATGVSTSASTTISWTGASAVIMPGSLVIAVTTACLHAARVQTVAANRLSAVLDIAAYANSTTNTFYHVGPWIPRDYRAHQQGLNASSVTHSLSGIGWVYVSNCILNRVTLTYGGYVFVANAPGMNAVNNGAITIQYSNDVTATDCKIIRTGIQTKRTYEAGVQLLTEGNTINFVNLEVYNLPVAAMSNVANISFTNTKSRHGIHNEGINFAAGFRAYKNPVTGNALANDTKYWFKTRSFRAHDFEADGTYIDSLPVCGAISNNLEKDHMPKFLAATPNYTNILSPGLAYGNGVWVTLVSGTQCALVSSDDGATWKTALLPAVTTWYKIAYVNSKFIAIGGGGAASAVFAWSSNGTDWVQASTAPASAWWQAIAYDAAIATNKLVVIGGAAAAYSGTLSTYSATTGDVWAAGTANPTTATWVDVASSGAGRFVQIAGGATASTASSYSTNGNSWTNGGALASSLWQAIAYGSSKFVCISASAVNGPTAYSTDGTSWTASTAPSLPTGNEWVNIIFTGSVFVITSGVRAQNFAATPTAVSFAQYYATSSDGITWSALKVLPSYTTWISACNKSGTAVGFLSTQSGHFAYTEDITAATPTWTLYRNAAIATWNRVAWERKDPCFTTTFANLTGGSTTAGNTTVTCASTADLFVGAIISTATPSVFAGSCQFGSIPGVTVTSITNATQFVVDMAPLRSASSLTFAVTKNCYQLFRSTTEGFTARGADELRFTTATAATTSYDDFLGTETDVPYYYILRKLNASATIANCSAVNGTTTITTSNNFYNWVYVNGFEGVLGSNTLTSKSQNVYSLGIDVGAIVTGTGIPVGTTITEIVDYNQIVLSANLTADIYHSGLAAAKIGFSPAPGQYVYGGCAGWATKVVSIDSATSMTVSVAQGFTMTNRTITIVSGNETAEVACIPSNPTIVQNNLLQSNAFSTTWTNSSSIALTAAAAFSPFDNLYGTTAALTVATGWKAQAIATSSVLSQDVQTGVGTAYTFSIWMRADLPTNASYVQVTLGLGTATTVCTLTNKWARYSVTFTTTAATTTASITFPLVNQQVYITYGMVTIGDTAPVTTTATTTAPIIQGGGSATAYILQQNFSRAVATMGAAGWNIDGGSGIELNLDTAPTGQRIADIHLGTTYDFTISDANRLVSTEAVGAQVEGLFGCTTGLSGLTVDTYEPVSTCNPPIGPMLYAINGASNITMKDLVYPMNGAGQAWINLVPAYNVYIHNVDVDYIKNGVALYMDGSTTNASKNIKLQNIRSNKSRLPWSNQALTMEMKGVFGAHAEPLNSAVIWNLSTNPTIDNLPIGQTAIYDSMFHEMTRTGDLGCLQVNMVGSAKTSKPYTVTAGSPYFKNDGGLAMKTAGDQMVIEWPHWIKGVTGFSRRMPVIYGTDLGAEATMTNIGCLIEYDLDKGSGYSNSWQRLTGNPDLLANETGIDATAGFKIKFRLTARQGIKYAAQGTSDASQFYVGQTIWNASANPTATAVIAEQEDLGATGTLILTSITGIWGVGNTIYTSAGVTTSATVAATNTISPYFPHVASKIQGIRLYTTTDTTKKYDFSSATLTLTGLKDNTEVRLITSGTNNEVYGVENVTDGDVNNRTFTYTYGYGGLTYVDVVIMSIGYEYMIIKNLPLTSTNASIPISQRADRNYQNL